MEQVVADVVERVAGGERGQEHEHRPAQPRGAVAREQPSASAQPADEDER